MASSSVTPGHGWLILFMVISLITLSHTQESTQVITARQLYPLTSYKDVQLFRFQVSEEVTLGQWTLWSNGTKGCDPIQVRFHLRWKGYPLLNVNNATISGNMFLDKKDQHQVELQSDSVQVHFNLTNPLPGDWFALAYISQVDDRIVQRGLFTKCQAWFSASLTQSHLPLRKDGQRSLTLAPGQPLMQVVSSHRYYRFQVPQEVTNVRVNITHCKVVGKLDHSHSVSSCPLDLSFRTSALPSRHYLKKTSNCQEHFEAESCQLSSLAVTYGGWNYIFVDVIKASHEDKFKVEFKITLHTEECTERSVHQVVHPSTPLPSTVSSTTVATSTALSSTTEIQGEDDAEWPDPDRESSAVEEASTETSPVLSVSEGNDSETDDTDDAEPKSEKPDIEGPKPESEIEAPSVENPKSEDLPESTSIGSVWSLSTEPGSGQDVPVAVPLVMRNRKRRNHHHFSNPNSLDLCPKRLKLIRYNSQGNFAFKYDYTQGIGKLNTSQAPQPFLAIPNSDANQTQLTLIDFEITPILDGGGMLTLELGVSPLTNITYHNISVLLCLNYGQTPLDVHVCDRQLQVNTSTVEAHFNSLFVPYPRSGLWFISLRSSCYFHDRTLGLAPETIHPVPCEFNTTSVILNVKSSACQTTCSKNGKCNQFVTGGLIFSTCTCKPGWKGWSCDDGSQVEPEEKLMFSFLLLTLSNLMFIPAVILATCKGHFAEALVYTITMVSSGLYHACDSQCDRAFCVVSPNLLQFGDFYSALLAFWVTLVSLGNLPVKLKGFLHFFGGIFIAFVVEYDRTSLWAFAIPAGVGVTIMLTGWVTQCIKHSSCYPSSKHWACSILPGLALSVGGLVVYGFFETRDNYAITHSIWHGSMAIALLFLVPTIKAGGKKRDNEDYRTSGSTSSETYYELIAEEASHLARHPIQKFTTE